MLVGDPPAKDASNATCWMTWNTRKHQFYVIMSQSIVQGTAEQSTPQRHLLGDIQADGWPAPRDDAQPGQQQ